MLQSKWTVEEQADGYTAMSDLNLTLAWEFTVLEEEAVELLSERFAAKD